MNLSRELQIGKAGEHLVCYDLIMQGYNAFLADQGLPYDVLVDLDDIIKRIQVKTCTVLRDYGKSKNVYRFSLRSAKYGLRAIKATSIDCVAFVFTEINVVQYIPKEKIITKDGNLKQCIDFRKDGGTMYVIGKYPFTPKEI